MVKETDWQPKGARIREDGNRPPTMEELVLWTRRRSGKIVGQSLTNVNRRKSAPAEPLATLPVPAERVASAHPWDKRELQRVRREMRAAARWAKEMTATAAQEEQA